MSAFPSPSKEFRLVAALCRRQFRSSEAERPVVVDGTDWSRVLRLARFHRVQGLVAAGLPPLDVPEELHAALKAEAERIAAQNLGLLAVCKGLATTFSDAGIPLLFVKGLTLAALAYRNPMLKLGWDIDILVDSGDVGRAAHLLEAGGYRLSIPAVGTRAQLRRWHRRRKESVWIGAGVAIELHSRLADAPQLIPSIDVRTPSRMVPVVSSVALPTLPDRELLTYLTVHGASSAWFRLKWLSDFAALLSGRSAHEIETWYRHAVDMHAGRAPGIALLLAEEIFDVPLGALGDELRKDSVLSRLAASAYRQLAGRSDPVEPTSRRFGTWRIHALNLRLLPGLGFPFRDGARRLRDALE